MSEAKQPDHYGLPLVVYTDGGERQGYSGSGIHGYFYDPAKTAEQPITTLKKDQPTTHGYVDTTNYEKMSQDFQARPVVPKVFIDGILQIGAGATNNVAELQAAIWAVQTAKAANAPQLTVLADSQYVVKGVNENLPTWKANGWLKADGQPPKSLELWQSLDAALLEYRAEKPAEAVNFLWTQAHVGNYGNERADSLATRGVYAARQLDPNCTIQKELDYSPAQGYLNPKVDHNRLLAGQHFYFFSNAKEARTSSDGRHIYYMGCQGGDGELHGKPVSDSTYIVAYLKEPDPVVDHLIAHQEAKDQSTYGRSYRGELSSILSSKLYSELKGIGLPYIRVHDRSRDLYIDDTLLIYERNPPLLAWRDEESLSTVRGLLECFLAQQREANTVEIPGLVVYDRQGARGVRANDYQITVTELTDHFFAKEEGKKKNTHKLTEFMSQTAKSVDVVVGYNTTGEVETTKLTLTVGLDLARRNTLGALLAQNPRVFALTWRNGDRGFRYATVVQTDSDVAIWCALHSNLRGLTQPGKKPKAAKA